MSICRIRKEEQPFTQLYNATLNDTEILTPEALGVLVYLLGKPNNWKVSVAEITRRFKKAGRDKVYRVIHELMAAGYVVRVLLQGEHGKLNGYAYDVHETPVPVEERTSPTDSSTVSLKAVNGSAVSGKAVYGSAVSGKTDTTNKECTNKEVKKEGGEKEIPKPPSGASEFSSSPGTTDEDDTTEVAETTELGSVRSADAEPGVAEQAPLDYGPLTNLPASPPDWCAAIRQYDLAAAQRLASIFKDGVSPLSHSEVARKLYKRRQAGLTGAQIELFTRCYRRSRAEGLERPHWKVKTLHELLSPAVLRDAFPACVEVLREDIEDINMTLSDHFDLQYVVHAFAQGEALADCSAESLHMLMDDPCAYPAGTFLAAVRKQHPGLAKAIARQRDRIINNMVYYREFLTLARAMQIDLPGLLGISYEELQAKQNAHLDDLQTRKADFLKLLSAL
jgi:hypothetical protein